MLRLSFSFLSTKILFWINLFLMKIFSNFTIQKYVLATQQIYPKHQIIGYLLLKTKKW